MNDARQLAASLSQLDNEIQGFEGSFQLQVSKEIIVIRQCLLYCQELQFREVWQQHWSFVNSNRLSIESVDYWNESPNM